MLQEMEGSPGKRASDPYPSLFAAFPTTLAQGSGDEDEKRHGSALDRSLGQLL